MKYPQRKYFSVAVEFFDKSSGRKSFRYIFQNFTFLFCARNESALFCTVVVTDTWLMFFKTCFLVVEEAHWNIRSEDVLRFKDETPTWWISDSWSWGHYTVSKLWETNTHWRVQYARGAKKILSPKRLWLKECNTSLDFLVAAVVRGIRISNDECDFKWDVQHMRSGEAIVVIVLFPRLTWSTGGTPWNSVCYTIFYSLRVICDHRPLGCYIRQDLPILILKKFLVFIVGVTGVCVCVCFFAWYMCIQFNRL